MRPRLLDLFSGAGGAAVGYNRAGFDVVGVDIASQPHYPFEFHQGDALKYALEHWDEFDAIHASPPCQAFTNAQRIMGNDHPDYITATRNLMHLASSQWERGWPNRVEWVIENVPGSPLRNPVTLCGSDFGLSTYRHRLFESSMPNLRRPCAHAEHLAPLAKMGRQPKPGEFMHVVGHFSGVKAARAAMGIDWMSRDELAESIPPAYTEWIGRQLLAALEAAAVMANHERRQPTWAGIADRLTAWAHEQPQTEHEESEMPNHSGTFEPENDRLFAGSGPSNRTTPGERANAPTEGLATDHVGVEMAYSQDTRTEAN